MPAVTLKSMPIESTSPKIYPIPISADGEPIMGKAPGLDNFFVSCGFTSGIAAAGGAGEASVPGVAPALAGAIHAATGHRPRRLPLVSDGWEFT